MSRRYFVSQTASKEILARVTNMCASCYCDLEEGVNIYYDMQECHYLCESCQEEKVITDDAEQSLKQSLGLF